ncbi:MAG: M20/M25/M40 family metallo-hydrolase [Bacteroidia bacterium]|nr:M20/M25/M40 family metallo-hydrolase [Bacteroidia bacterium]
MKTKILFLFLSSISLATFSQKKAPEISETLLKTYVKYLASDKLEGRGTGTAGEAKAGAYITGILEKTGGLTPKGTTSWFYDFTFRFNPNPHDTDNSKAIERKGRDILAYIDNGAENTIIIGAHYDHLGLGNDHNSLDANPTGKIHNGADDNASGSAGLMELARYFASNNKKEQFNFLFCWFSGEELGLYGSKKFCEKPTIDFAKVNYMINLDMIGRLNDTTKKLLVYGVGTSPTWTPLMDKLQNGFTFKYDSSGIGPSDQTSFYLKDLPVLFFFTGQHADYHKPTDDWDKLNYKGEKKVLELVIKVVEETEKMPKLTFTKTKSAEATTRKYKVTMGIMPDYAFEGKGVHVDGVTDDRPAAIAGVQRDDIIIQLGDVKVENMQDYMKALGKIEKGMEVPAKILRGGKEIELKVKF